MFHVKHWRVPEVPDVSRETFYGRGTDQDGRQMFHVKHPRASTSFPQAGSTLAFVHPPRDSAGVSIS